MVVHLCRKVLYGCDVSYRIGLYVLGTLLISVVGDYKVSAQGSRAYLANPNNFFNQFFVKLGWGWTLAAVGSFTYFTARTYSCGWSHILRRNLVRLCIATAVWFGVTQLFQVIEQSTGVCEVMKYTRKEACNNHGYLWKGFDISGHCFLLIFSNLFIIEEGKAYLGWERIKDFLRLEEHKRINDLKAKDLADTPISKLKNEEFLWLRKHFTDYTPYVRLIFCSMALLSMLWDFMLLTTLLYHHIMIEKVVASSISVLIWFALYKFFYQQEMSPGLPGDGIFKYVTWTDPSLTKKTTKPHRQQPTDKQNKWTQQDEIPKFMGMPLYALKDYKKEEAAAAVVEEVPEAAGPRRGSLSTHRAGGRQGSISDLNIVRPLGRARSRSQSRSRMGSSTSKNSLNYKF